MRPLNKATVILPIFFSHSAALLLRSMPSPTRPPDRPALADKANIKVDEHTNSEFDERLRSDDSRVRSSRIASSLSKMIRDHRGSAINFQSEYAKMSLRRFNSTRFVPPGHQVACLSLMNIAVDVNHRRKGHARAFLSALRHAAYEHQHILIVENVVSEHMHALIKDFGGESLPGSRAGARGCHYWLPPVPGGTWKELAMPV